MRSSLAAAVVLVGATDVRAQTTAPKDTIAEARRLRDAGDYAAASAILRPYVQAHPNDPRSARFAALMSYWAKDARTADSIYADALARHPDDAELRLEYGRLLVETRQDSRARATLAPFTSATVDSASGVTSAAAARARALLGTLAYWNGDYVGARRRFIDALRLDSSHVDARRQLREIETAAAAWVRVGGTGWDDDQPLSHFTMTADGGWFANPLTPLTVRARAIRFDTDRASETVSLAEAGLSTYIPAARMDLGIAAGALQRTFDAGNDWTGRLTLGWRLPASAIVQLTAERAPYFNTTSSLATAVMTRTVSGTVRWRPNGWMIEGVARHERYSDDNDISTGYAWLLAPLLRRRAGTLHAGYSFAAQSAATGRFVPRDDGLQFPPGQVPAAVPGKYDPYYTPRNLRVHSALASVRLVPNARWTLTSGAAYALHGRDDAPMLVVVPSPPDVDIVRTYVDRRFTPWDVRGAIDVAVTEATRLGFVVEHGQRAYYRFTTFGVSGTYTFVAAARHRADNH